MDYTMYTHEYALWQPRKLKCWKTTFTVLVFGTLIYLFTWRYCSILFATIDVFANSVVRQMLSTGLGVGNDSTSSQKRQTGLISVLLIPARYPTGKTLI